MIDKKTETVIAKAKAFCEANYENGFDEFVECYSDADWLEEAKYEDYHEKVISGEVMPENLQDSEKAETANEAVENLQEAICLLEEIADLDFDQEEINEKIDAACN